MRNRGQDKVRRLSSLQDAPEDQATYACQLLVPENGLEVIRAAVAMLANHPVADARQDLCALYWHFSEHNGTRDPGTYTRSAILKALRPIIGMEDTKLVVHAVSTYEFLPPGFTEEAALLRSTAIVLLNELEDELATYFGTRLLADGYTELMSGEPALTAVRVLASQGELLPLYFYASQQQGGHHPEATSECLRNLGDAPEAIVSELVAQYGDSDDRAALVGLFDMLLLGTDAPRHTEYLTEFLKSAEDLDLYRYLITVMISSPNADIRQLLVDGVCEEQNTQKIEALTDALKYAPDSPEIGRLKGVFA